MVAMKKRFLFLSLLVGMLFGLTMFTSCSEDVDDNIVYGVGGVKLDRINLTLTVGNAPVELEATVLPSNATRKNVTWSTSDSTVVIVTDDSEVTPFGIIPIGLVTPVGPGTAIISATAESKSATCSVSVNPAW